MTVRKFDETPIAIRLVTAGIAACNADLVAFPLDTAKVLLQVDLHAIRGVFNTISTVAKRDGPLRLYQGLAAGLQRQMCFASVRIGLYDTFKNFYQEKLIGNQKPNGVLDLLTRISAGMTTGALAVLVAQPTDIVKVRYQAMDKEAKYKSTMEAYMSIYKNEGVKGLWRETLNKFSLLYTLQDTPTVSPTPKLPPTFISSVKNINPLISLLDKVARNSYSIKILGSDELRIHPSMFPNIARNAIVNVSEIVCYDLVKSAILERELMENNTLCHFTSAVIAGFFTTVVSSPVDVIKTRYMNSPPGQYSNAIDCALKTAKLEGFTAFYKG
ncbi:hypothetical protein RUM44_005552 [Polyplax serrata]|uniref:Uncharacterized protein n=1 Tax=Polyplax serrata TaxID=468196 RepID=A0ABR1ADP9_POLSC